ncbi:MAG: DUF4440 domain-containing protein [Paracoccaceae bacterium]|nr:MAG: DUF4440 domain-containing protein [Paracoccaceae bacterium]
MAGDADLLAAVLATSAGMLTLSGQWCEGRDAIFAAMRAERRGALARARVVGGRATCRAPAEHLRIVAQRFVISGLCDAGGQEMPRQAAMLTATLLRGGNGWTAEQLAFAPVA